MPYQVVERVPIEAYLRTSYEPASDFVDGEVRERCCGLGMHSRMLGAVVMEFAKHNAEWGVMTLPLLSVLVASTRVRISEVCLVLRKNLQLDGIATKPPLVSVDIWQEDDVWEDQLERAKDFLSMGVKGVWLIDPYGEIAYRATADSAFVREEQELTVEGTPVRVNVAQLFEDARLN